MKEKIISLATADKQDEILKKIDSLKEEKKDESVDIVDQLILTGAFTSNSTVASMNWIWNSEKMGKVASMMIPSEKEKFIKKTNLDSIFADKETRRIFINNQGLMDTAMNSFGVKRLFIKNIDAVIEMLKSDTAKDYILSDKTAINEILNNDVDLKKFYDEFISSEKMRVNIMNSPHRELSEKLATQQNILTYYINHGKKTNDFLTYNQLFSSDKALQNDYVKKNMNYNFIELASIMNGGNLDVIMRNDLLKNFVKSKDEKVLALIRDTDEAYASAFKYKESTNTIVSNLDLYERAINSKSKVSFLCNSRPAVNVVAGNDSAISRLLSVPDATDSLFSSEVGMNEFLKFPKAYDKIIEGTLKDKIIDFTPAMRELVKNNEAYEKTLNDNTFREKILLNKNPLSVICENTNESFVKALNTQNYARQIYNNKDSVEQITKDKNAINTFMSNTELFKRDFNDNSNFRNSFMESDICGEVFSQRKDSFESLKDWNTFLNEANRNEEKAFRFFSSEYIGKMLFDDIDNWYKYFSGYQNIRLAMRKPLSKLVYEAYTGDFFTGEETKKRLLKDPAFYDKFCLGSRYLYLYAKDNMKSVYKRSEDSVNYFNVSRITSFFKDYPNAVIFTSLGSYNSYSDNERGRNEKVYSYVHIDGKDKPEDKYTYDFIYRPNHVDENNVSAVLLEGMGLREYGDGWAAVEIFVPK